MMVHSFSGIGAPSDSGRVSQRKSLIRTISLDAEKRYAAILPSRPMAKLLMKPELKLVTCFGGPPSSETVQTLRTPELESRKATDFPSGSHDIAIGCTVNGRSMVFTV